MNSEVHGVIVRAIKNVVDPSVLEILYTNIDKDAWKKVRTELKLDENAKNPSVYEEAENYFDILCLGAVDEDNTSLLSDVEDPDAKACAMGKILVSQSGEHQHWLEHFWNDSLSDDRSGGKKAGFSINHGYIADVVSEITGTNYLQTFMNFGGYKLGTNSNEAVTYLVEAAIALYYGDNLYDTYYSAPNRAERYWKKAIEQYQNKELERAFYNLGKVCHLLADVGTPAHVHNDGHMGVNWLKTILSKIGIDVDVPDFFKVDDDKYEVTTGKIIEENLSKLDKDNADEALPQNWRLTDSFVYCQDWKLYNYFNSLADHAKKYDSDDVDGSNKGIGKPYHWEHFDLLNFDSYTRSLERCPNDDLTEYACNAIAQDLIPSSIAHTVGVIYLFFMSVNEVVTYPKTYKVNASKIHIHNDEDSCQGGEIYFTFKANAMPPCCLPKISANSGDVKNLNGKWKCEIETPSTTKGEIKIHTEAEDNDDWTVLGITVHKAKDSLGHTDDIINASDVEKSKQPIEMNTKSSNGDYTIYYSVQNGHKMVKKYNLRKHIKNSPAEVLERLMTKTNYREGYSFLMQPLLLNLDTHNFHSNTTSHKDCKTWSNADGVKVKAYMYDKEIAHFRKISPKDSISTLKGIMKHIDKILTQDEKKQKFIKYLNENLKVSSKISESDIKDYTKHILTSIEKPEFKSYINTEENKKNVFSCIPNLSTKTEEYINSITERNFYEKFNTSCSCCSDKTTLKYLDLRKIMY